MLEKFKKRTVENIKGTIREEAAQYMNDILPTLVGLASLALFLFCNTQPSKPITQAIIINNYYYKRRS